MTNVKILNKSDDKLVTILTVLLYNVFMNVILRLICLPVRRICMHFYFGVSYIKLKGNI
jgi:hypothetical protein